MMDPKAQWLVIETEEDKEIEKKNIQNTFNNYPYKTFETYYEQLKPLLAKYTKYLLIGYAYSNEPMLSAILEINGYRYTINGFKTETMINMKHFREFWNKLTEGYILHDYTSIEISFYKYYPVFITLKQYNPNDRRNEVRNGIILPEI